MRTWCEVSNFASQKLRLTPALPTCLVVYVRKSDFHLINVFCVVVVVKQSRLLCLAQVVFSYFVLHSSKIPLVSYDQSYTFAQPADQTARWS